MTFTHAIPPHIADNFHFPFEPNPNNCNNSSKQQTVRVKTAFIPAATTQINKERGMQ